MRKVLLTVLGAALFGFVPLAQAQAHWECMGFAVACEGSGGSVRQARDDRYEAPSRRYAGRYERDYAPKQRHRAESRHETAKQQTASLEPAKAQDKVAETKSIGTKAPEAKVETKATETTVAKADIKADAKAPEAKRADLPVERKVATTEVKTGEVKTGEVKTGEVKTLRGTGKTQSGMASYYGTESGSQTSSGEHFNPNAMTAAHRTLPFGTKVLVTNKRNGRSVVVRINDRGPFVSGRIIDLSTAAAGVIGMRGAGVASVTVEVLQRS
jgi:rare lipoprotein A (peptidoglycan hydrolase)